MIAALSSDGHRAAGVFSVWADGERLDAGDLLVPALVNYGHFTAMQVRGGAVRGLGEHLARVRSANQELFGSDLDPEVTRAQWATAASETPDAYLRASFQESPPGRTHHLVVLRPPVEPSRSPARLRSVRYIRALAHLKHVGTFPQIRHGREAERAGYDDALLTTDDGQIAETTAANIGFLSGGTVIWPTAPALDGIGQQLLRAVLPAAGYHVEHGAVRVRDLADFDGAFIVNSIGVVPVGQIDEHRFREPQQAVTPIVAAHDQLPRTTL